MNENGLMLSPLKRRVKKMEREREDIERKRNVFFLLSLVDFLECIFESVYK